MCEINDKNSIFKFILDYFKDKNHKVIFKKYKEFLENYNVLNLLRLAKEFHYDFLTYYLYLYNIYCDQTEILETLQKLENKLEKFYNIKKSKIPNFNIFFFKKKNFTLNK